ncbi:MAG TPA: GNAT family N-acetyltransferase [Acidimicrobiales bacterium]|nr:GNAT family N-acetyltransferase [Acidimicrobiales bacterium]
MAGEAADTAPGRAERLGTRRVDTALPALVRAFWDYEETVHLLPSARRRRRVLPRYLLSDLCDARRAGQLWVVAEGSDILGAAAWLAPGAYPVSPWRQVAQGAHLAPALPWGLGTLREAWRGRDVNRRHHAGFRPHYWLMALGVEPRRQGEGLGSSLLAPVLELADESATGCFLFTARPANTAWYERFGFRVQAEYRPTPTWPTVWSMWRDPLPPQPGESLRPVRPPRG